MTTKKNPSPDNGPSAALTSSGEASDALTQFNVLRDALTQTHAEIPTLLAGERDLVHQLGLAEANRDSNVADLRGQLERVLQEHQAAVRRRAASVEAILQMESALQTERGIAEAERQRIAAGIVLEFNQRWSAACNALSTLRAEAEALGSALCTTIATPAPFTTFLHPVTGVPALRPVATSEPAPVPVLPANLSALVRRLDALDAGLTRCASIRQGKQLDQRFYDLSRVRGQPAEFGGVYLCMAPFDSLTDGLPFQPGMLIDASLVGPGSMHRLTLGRRYIRPVDLLAA
jgi:hypothetical protein